MERASASVAEHAGTFAEHIGSMSESVTSAAEGIASVGNVTKNFAEGLEQMAVAGSTLVETAGLAARNTGKVSNEQGAASRTLLSTSARSQPARSRMLWSPSGK